MFPGISDLSKGRAGALEVFLNVFRLFIGGLVSFREDPLSEAL